MKLHALNPIRMALVAAVFALGTPAFGQDDPIIATVGDQKITESELKVAESELNQQFQRMPPEQRRVAALSALIEIKVMAAKATAEGLADGEDFKKRFEFLRQKSLHEEYVRTKITKELTDEAVRARYDKEVAATPPQNEVRARHILVKTKEEAQAIIKELEGGADFAKLANEKSQDKGGGDNGGDLGYFGPGQMVPEFEKVAFTLDVGQFTKEPVQTQFGFHVIKVEDKRQQQPPAFDQVKEQMRSALLRERYVELAKQVRDEAKVEVTDPALKKIMDGEAKPAEAPAPAGGEQETPKQ
jgi:peptidyl-prolyl cis-trans isomerase C